MIINELDYLETLASSIQLEGGATLTLVLPLIEILEEPELETELRILKKPLVRGNYSSDLFVSTSGNGSSASASSSTSLNIV